MAIKLIRYRPANATGNPEARWGVEFGGRIAPLNGDYLTTADVVLKGREAARGLTAADALIRNNFV